MNSYFLEALKQKQDQKTYSANLIDFLTFTKFNGSTLSTFVSSELQQCSVATLVLHVGKKKLSKHSWYSLYCIIHRHVCMVKTMPVDYKMF